MRTADFGVRYNVRTESSLSDISEIMRGITRRRVEINKHKNGCGQWHECPVGVKPRRFMMPGANKVTFLAYSCEARNAREVGAHPSGRAFLYICIHLPTYIVRQTRVIAQVYNFEREKKKIASSISFRQHVTINRRRAIKSIPLAGYLRVTGIPWRISPRD